MRQRIVKWVKDLLDDALYAFVDGIAVIAASIDFLIDVACSRGHPKASWLKYVQSGRSQLGWFLFTIQQRKMLLKANPNIKVFCFIGKQDMFGNADEMTPDMRHLMRNSDKILEELKKPDQKDAADN